MDIRRIKLFVFIVLAFFSAIGETYGQVERLVSWEGYRDNWSAPTNNPSYYNSSNNYISAGSITGNNINFTTTYSRFDGTGSNGWPTASSPDYTKYIQISISADEGYQISLDRLKFRQSGYCGAYEIRFSTDVAFPSNGTFLYQNTNASATYNQDTDVYFPSNAVVGSGETLYVRFYGYQKNINNHPWGLNNSPYNLQTETSSEIGPAFYGEISLASMPPAATNDNAITAQNIPVDIDILDNDSYSTLSTITITEQPTNGQNITVNGLTNVTYTPNNNYIGADSFKYTITDENGTSDEATVNINVSLPTAPTAVADAASVTANQTININVLSNDTQGSGAFDYVTVVTGPTNGSVMVNPNNTVAYTPNTSYTGADSFQYNVTNMHNMTSNTVTVSIDVIPYDPCASCTHTISGSTITVNDGEVYCLHSGSWSGGVRLNAGGVICIAEGATFNVSYLIDNAAVNGTIINRGAITAFPMYNNTLHNATIENYGTFTSGQIQHFVGTLENYGSFTVTGGFTTPNTGGGEIHNYGNIVANNIHFYDAEVHNYNDAEFTVTNGVNVYSGYWNNRLGGAVYMNGGNVNFTGGLDNSGYWEFERISSLSSTLNNYGQMKVFNAASNISSTTYLTNDDLLEFINVPEIQYNGPMLTNNGTITVTHGTTGNFKMNQAINQVFNNGLIVVSGQFEQNDAGSLLVNNCTIECETFFVGNGVAENSGLIWAKQNVSIQGTASSLINAATGHIRGVNFTNSGEISGYGAFYFTGTTNMNTGGSMIGDEPNSILFFDASQTGSQIFDTPGGTVTNVIRPDTMEPMDTDSYDCVAPPSVAGYPPTTNPFDTILCEPETVLIALADLVAPHAPVDDIPFTLLYNTVKLFEFDNESNPTNNSTSLVIPGKGTFTANTTTGLVTFVPDVAFTSGVVEAEYRISNERAGDPIVYPSPRTKITITLINIDLPPIEIEEGVNPVCVGQTVTLSNEVEGGVWSSSNEAVATVDENGVVTGVTPGTTTISYKVTEQGCEETVTLEITVQTCSAPGSLLITNPMIRQRVKGGGD